MTQDDAVWTYDEERGELNAQVGGNTHVIAHGVDPMAGHLMAQAPQMRAHLRRLGKDDREAMQVVGLADRRPEAPNK